MVQDSHTPRGVEGAHDFLGNSANTDLICQAKGERGQAPVPTPTLETNKQTNKQEKLGAYCPNIYIVVPRED